MAREQNFFYQNPAEAIGSGLARAMFGDPAMAQKQQSTQAEVALRRAEAAHAQAEAALATSKTTGVNSQNTAASEIPDIYTKYFGPPPGPPDPVAIQALNDPTFTDGSGPPPQAHPLAPPEWANEEERHRLGAAKLATVIARMNGEHADPTKVTGSLFAAMGGDNLSRSALIAQGVNPSKDFATTADRADAIAAADDQAKQLQAWGVADRGAAAHRYAADQQLQGTRYTADSHLKGTEYSSDNSLKGTRYTADKHLEGTEYGADRKGTGAGGNSVADRNNNPGNLIDGAFTRSMPGYKGANGRFAVFDSPEAGTNAQVALLGQYLAKGHNTPTSIVERYAPAGDGSNNPAAYAAFIATHLGIGPNDPITPDMVPQLQKAMASFEGWHGGPPAPAKAQKPPKMLAPNTAKALNDAVDAYITEHGAEKSFTPVAKQVMYSRAQAAYQKSGNIAGAVLDAFKQSEQRRNDRVARGEFLNPSEKAARAAGTFTMDDVQHTAQLHNVPVAKVLADMRARGLRQVN